MSDRSNELQGKTALITGGNSGIGLATARLFVQRGGKVLITGRDRKTLDAAARELGASARAVQADAASLGDIDRSLAEAKAFLGRIDLLFVNAGVGGFKPIAEFDEAAYDLLLDVNLKGAFFTMQKALPLLGEGASIVANTSVLGIKGMAGTSVYSATKAGLRSLVRTFATELAGRGIRVNAVAPGPTETPILGRGGASDAELKETKSGLSQMTLLKRMGTADEVAESVLFLASPGAGFITGVELHVDGGYGQV